MNRFVLSILGLACIVTSLAADDSLKETLVQNWKELLRIDSLPKRCVIEHTADYGNHKTNSMLTLFVGIDSAKIEAKSSVACWNSQYTFLLRSRKGTDEWVLAQFEPEKPETNQLRKAILTNGNDGESFYPLTWFYNNTCLDYVQNGRLVLGGSQETSDSKLKINVTWKVNFHPMSPPEREEILTGHIIVDPRSHYVISEAVLNRSNPRPGGARRMTMKREYDSAAGVLRVNVIEHVTDTGQIEAFRFGDFNPGPVSETEFRLSHYNMPEPLSMTWKKPTPTYVWILVAAAVCGLASVALRYSYRRFHPAPR